MLVNTNLTTLLDASIDATQTTITLKNTGQLSSLLSVSGTYGFLELSDGINNEVVKIESIAGAVATVVRGSTSYAFIKGTCVKTDAGFKTICALLAQGGCDATGSCTPVSRGTTLLPDATIGKPYAGLVAFPNATSLSATLKPLWMTATVVGQTITLSGTPTVGSEDFVLAFAAQGCNSSVALHSASVRICEQVGVA
jgi:hypothetical protein